MISFETLERPNMNTMNLIGFFTTLIGVAFQLHAAEKTPSRADAAEPRVFNVLNYGAVGDDTADVCGFAAWCLFRVSGFGWGACPSPSRLFSVPLRQ